MTVFLIVLGVMVYTLIGAFVAGAGGASNNLGLTLTFAAFWPALFWLALGSNLGEKFSERF